VAICCMVRIGNMGGFLLIVSEGEKGMAVGVGYRVSGIGYRVSGIRYRVSGIGYCLDVDHSLSET
jgi:hypothetical protein